VRIAAEKLDALLGRNGELLVARRRLPPRTEELAALGESVSRWRGEWQAVEKPLAALAEQDGAAAADQALLRRASLVLKGQGQRLRRLEKDLERLTAALVGDSRLIDQVADALDDEVRRARMLPFAEACQGLARMVEDLAVASGKAVDLVLGGGDVELDRSVLEGLKDPLRHLLRNAVDHGAEPPAQRSAAGKPARARVTVDAVLRGAQVEVVVADDGRGLDLDALRQQARKKGLPEPADDHEAARLVFHPGLSTSRLITDVSGRGIGLDVVKSQVEALHGTVDVTFTPGQGTRFTLAVPLTLTTLRAVLVGAGGQTFAFVGTSVEKLVRIDPAQVRSVQGREVLSLGGAPLPVVSLLDVLGRGAAETGPARGKMPAVVLTTGHRHMIVVVDELLAEQEIVVKGLGARIRRVPHVAAATILPSGRIALVLNAANLMRTALARSPAAGLAPRNGVAEGEARKRILIAEDSLTTRTLEKTILEAAGYEVEAVGDGEAAWNHLQQHGADLLVSDVEMPGLDGFTLTQAVRGSKRFHDLPVVLVTGHDRDEDRAHGLEAGANAYLVKSAFDQRNLLETIAQLL
jgi:two-component system chemotaxis sensor kinase CheA